MSSDFSSPMRRVTIYGRVSTPHEAQISAMDNQKQWYEDEAARHDNWIVVARYYDEGITGTNAKKRPQFLKMLAAAHRKEFDLIITREVCRFARNTVDTLSITRDLKLLGIEVYFISDNIRTMDSDGELRLTIMASMAQEESRKTSERVRAGQQTSRERGVLYGSGNILGYRRVGKTYVIEPEEAETVRMIFDLYSQGNGYMKICNILTAQQRKSATGLTTWTCERIGRILGNATYKGYIVYNKSNCVDYLSKKRVTNSSDKFIYIKGDFPPIVSEELWDKCAAIRQKRSTTLLTPEGTLQKFGSKEPQSVWSKKLRCSCGSAFRRFMWRVNADGTKAYGFECYRQKRSASRQVLEHGLDPSIICTSKSIPEWHINLMCREVFRTVWQGKKDCILQVCKMIETCATKDASEQDAALARLNSQLQKLERRAAGLREMRSLGDISREEFLSDSAALQAERSSIEEQIAQVKEAADAQEVNSGINLSAIRKTLERWLDLSDTRVDDALIDEFVLQAVELDDNTFNFTLNLDARRDSHPNFTASQIALQSYREKNFPDAPSCIDCALTDHILNPRELLRFTVTREMAAAYCKEIGLKFFGKKWHDKTVIISI